MHPGVHAQLQRAAHDPITIDITTIGRRSGCPRRIEIWMMNVDGSFVIGGTPGRRDWYANLLADPHLTVHFNVQTSIDLPARASPVTDDDRRRRIYEHRAAAWYRSQATVDELVAAGPTVAVVFDDPWNPRGAAYR